MDKNSSTEFVAHKSRLGLWVIVGVLSVLLLPLLLVVMSNIRPSLADIEVARLCKMDGGIRVFETAHLAPGESLVPGPIDWAHYDSGRTIGQQFRIKQNHAFWHEYGAAVYKYTVWVERNTDKKRLSERIWYLREGNEIFHGTHCPEHETDEELIARTLTLANP